MDFLTAYRRGLVEFTERVAQVGDDQWSRPTPCTDWDVRALVNHVVGEDLWTVPLMAGRTIAEVGDEFDGDLLGDDPAGAAASAAAAAEAAMEAPGALDRTTHLSFGDIPALEYGRQLLADHLIHAWDLAAATGAPRELDADAVRYCAEWFAGMEDTYRGSGAIGPRPATAAATEQDRLLVAFGRDPQWTATPEPERAAP